MNWTAQDMDTYLQQKEYIDTLIVPLLKVETVPGRYEKQCVIIRVSDASYDIHRNAIQRAYDAYATICLYAVNGSDGDGCNTVPGPCGMHHLNTYFS